MSARELEEVRGDVTLTLPPYMLLPPLPVPVGSPP